MPAYLPEIGAAELLCDEPENCSREVGKIGARAEAVEAGLLD